jgi:ADP-heptose:LPS heptosyltransferase
MLATPIATSLKMNYPAAKLTYWTHPELRSMLLGLCPSIDEVVDYVRDANVFQLGKTFEELRPDLFIDLANSTKSKAITWLARTKVLRYEKQNPNVTPIRHAAINFLDTVRPVCPELPNPLFPTIFPDALVDQTLAPFLEEQQRFDLPMIGIVPGVGKHRPHRAWFEDGYAYLLEHIFNLGTHQPVLIGGSDEVDLCDRLNAHVGHKCLNLAGRLSLSQTAAVLKRCVIVISGDTGPAHIAVAVGTPVIGLYGPTYLERSGPFGCADLCLSQTAACRCQSQKHCLYAAPNEGGQCMRRIMLTEVTEKLRLALLGEASID